MNRRDVILCLFFVVSLVFADMANAQKPQTDVCLKIGGNYYINCANTIVFGTQPVMTISGNENTGRKVNCDIFSPQGKLEAKLYDGVFSGPHAKFYAINRQTNGFMITDTRTLRQVLKVVYYQNPKLKRLELHVTADLYLPNGQRFQCTPETTNNAFINMLKGSTFTKNYIAIQLN